MKVQLYQQILMRNFSFTIVDGEVYFRENSQMIRQDLKETELDRD